MTKGKETKPHIGILGRRNVGKSSVINILAGQEVAIVSDIAGTTTDPVKKSIEIQAIGPAVLVDTAGIDDTGELGQKRVGKSMQALASLDAAIIIFDGDDLGDYEYHIIERLRNDDIPFVLVHNKSDMGDIEPLVVEKIQKETGAEVIGVSARMGIGIDLLIGALQKIIPETAYHASSLLEGLISQGDVVMLITPIDTEAPEGRMILPQVQVIRDILDHSAVAVVAREPETEELLKRLSPRPVLAITDSQVFQKASASVPDDIPLTSFSIVLAHHKGDFPNYLKGTPRIGDLKDGDRVLLLESCTHHVTCDDIGRVKIPGWLTKKTGKKLDFDVVAGLDKLPRDIHEYAMVIQCGGCMITRRQLINRLKPAVDAGVPVSNYGMTIAWLHGIFPRAVAPFAKVFSS